MVVLPLLCAQEVVLAAHCVVMECCSKEESFSAERQLEEVAEEVDLVLSLAPLVA